MIYESYDETFIDWIDEIGVLSGGTPDPMYENTTVSPWYPLDDLVYSEGAVMTIEEAQALKQVVLGQTREQDMPYNRGLIFHVSKAYLCNIPLNKTLSEVSWISSDGSSVVVETPGVVAALAYTGSSVVLTASFGDEGVCVSELIIGGYWGVFIPAEGEAQPRIKYSKPIVSIAYKSISGGNNLLPGYTPYTEAIPPSAPTFYIKTHKINVCPKYMIEDRIVTLKVTLSAPPGTMIAINTMTVALASYKELTETIQVWERKYVYSTFTPTTSPNPDGPQKILRGNGVGPFFPVSYDMAPMNAPYNFINKLRGIWASKLYPMTGDEAVTKKSMSLGTLQANEVKYQKELYELAYNLDTVGDTLKYTTVRPIKLKDSIFTVTANPFTSESIAPTWEDASTSYVNFPFWSPGGHKWTWGPDCVKTNCWLISHLIDDVYFARLVHVAHGGITKENVPRVGDAFYTSRAKYMTELMSIGEVSPEERLAAYEIDKTSGLDWGMNW